MNQASGRTLVGAWRDALLDFVLPRACVVCDRMLAARDPGPACGVCWTRVAYLSFPQCERCGHPVGAFRCRWCEFLPPFVRAGRSVCWVPGGSAGGMVHALKYGGWTAMASHMADRMARLAWPRDVAEERTALVPVPLAPVRQRERGYNQSLLLARPLGASWDLPVWPDVLERLRITGTQTRLTPEERRSNVAGAFRAVSGARHRLRGAHVILVDDVVTTGATLVECAAALLYGGARIVSFVTFGRARASGDHV
jgi:ComF family protein